MRTGDFLLQNETTHANHTC